MSFSSGICGLTTTVEVYSKSIKNTLSLFTHNYFAIPALNLEIHPGQYLYGTHHDRGRFSKRSILIGKLNLCGNCLERLMKTSANLFDVWYYPLINCETLTRGLLYHDAISYQTVFGIIIFTAFVIGINKPIMFIVGLFFLFILLVINNLKFIYREKECIHLKEELKHDAINFR